MKMLLPITLSIFSFFGFSQQEKQSIYFPQEQLIHPDCENAEDKNECFYQNLEKKIYLLLSKKKSKKVLDKFEKDTLVITFTVILDNNGLLEEKTSSCRVNSRKAYNKLKSNLQKELFGLPKFEILNRKKDPVVSKHFFNLNYLVKKNGSQVELKHLTNEKPYTGGVIEEIPIFPGCENLSQQEGRKCFNMMMQNHIASNFRYPEVAEKKGISGRVSIMFTINEEGKQTKIRMRGPDPILEEEASRIIKLLPDFKPALQNGKAVKIPFSIPITFKLQ